MLSLHYSTAMLIILGFCLAIFVFGSVAGYLAGIFLGAWNIQTEPAAFRFFGVEIRTEAIVGWGLTLLFFATLITGPILGWW